MGNVDYIPLYWKEGFNKKPIIPIAYFKFKELWDNTLLVAGFRQSERLYSMRVGAGGRLDGTIGLSFTQFRTFIVTFLQVLSNLLCAAMFCRTLKTSSGPHTSLNMCAKNYCLLPLEAR